jgi:phospholipase A-2-activating protein
LGFFPVLFLLFSSIPECQWSAGETSWKKIGEVVNAVSDSRKQSYQGREWDYVFDVQLDEGGPSLKLPYNVNGALLSVPQSVFFFFFPSPLLLV